MYDVKPNLIIGFHGCEASVVKGFSLVSIKFCDVSHTIAVIACSNFASANKSIYVKKKKQNEKE